MYRPKCTCLTTVLQCESTEVNNKDCFPRMTRLKRKWRLKTRGGLSSELRPPCWVSPPLPALTPHFPRMLSSRTAQPTLHLIKDNLKRSIITHTHTNTLTEKMHTNEHPNNYYNFNTDSRLQTRSQTRRVRSLTNPRTWAYTASLHKPISSHSASILYRLSLNRTRKNIGDKRKLIAWHFEDFIFILPLKYVSECVFYMYLYMCAESLPVWCHLSSSRNVVLVLHNLRLHSWVS